MIPTQDQIQAEIAAFTAARGLHGATVVDVLKHRRSVEEVSFIYVNEDEIVFNIADATAGWLAGGAGRPLVDVVKEITG